VQTLLPASDSDKVIYCINFVECVVRP